MKKHNRYVLGLCLLASPAVFADSLELMGRVDKAPVVLSVSVGDDHQVSGRYFYRKYRRDIDLAGFRSADGKTIELCEGYEYVEGGRCKGMRLLADGQGRWTGEWHDEQNKKKLPVALEPLKVGADSAQTAVWPKDEGGGRYGWSRLEGLSLNKGKTETVQGRQLQWWTEPVSKVSMFRVAGGYPAPTLERINKVLEKRHWENISGALECSSPHGGSSYEFKATPRLLGDSAFSASIFVSYYCGGAHPDFADQPINLDLASGRELELSDMLWLGKGQPVAQTVKGQTTPEWTKYSEETMAPWLAKTMARLYPGKMDKDACNYAEKDIWSLPVWYLTPKGLYFSPSFARVARACEYPDWSVLPWSEVEQHRGRFKAKLP